MNQAPPRDPLAEATRGKAVPSLRHIALASVLTCLWLVPLLVFSDWTAGGLWHSHASQPAATIQLTNGAARWLGDTRTAAPGHPFPAQPAAQAPVDPAFAAYYRQHDGASLLGTPITPAFPVQQGWVQFFSADALLLPSSSPSASSTGGSLPAELLRDGLRDPTTGVVRLPLLHSLLTAGSLAHVLGGSLTYADLRAASQPAHLVAAPTLSSAATATGGALPAGGGAMFVAGGRSGHASFGHIIPPLLWQYITRPDISPDGWSLDFGPPLTEALPFTATINGMSHSLQVQAFWRGALVVDQSTPDAAGNPTIMPLPTGVDYLQTLGPPAPAPVADEHAWVGSASALVAAPGSTTATVHLGMNYPLTLTGTAQWVEGMPWYKVSWRSPSRSGSGWLPATAVTLTSPGTGAAWASFDVLSPDLAAYLNGLGSHAGAVVYDVTRGTYYTYNAQGQFIMASSAKVPIMLTFLSTTEGQERAPDDNEQYLLTTMIENSNNDSAQALFDEIGGTGPMTSFMQRVHVAGMSFDPDAWGWSTTSPLAMVNLLTLLHDGQVLTAQDRALALNLMENIESDQQVGVGDTAPSGATVAMKDGWVQDQNGQWAVNSSGIVTVGGETYIIAVYTQQYDDLATGQGITEHVCGAIAQLLQ
jgi:beta-lactamase class A